MCLNAGSGEGSASRSVGRSAVRSLPHNRPLRIYPVSLLLNSYGSLPSGVAGLENARHRADIARPPKLYLLTSQDWKMRDCIARVDIARPDNARRRQVAQFQHSLVRRDSERVSPLFPTWGSSGPAPHSDAPMSVCLVLNGKNTQEIGCRIPITGQKVSGRGHLV